MPELFTDENGNKHLHHCTVCGFYGEKLTYYPATIQEPGYYGCPQCGHPYDYKREKEAIMVA